MQPCVVNVVEQLSPTSGVTRATSLRAKQGVGRGSKGTAPGVILGATRGRRHSCHSQRFNIRYEEKGEMGLGA